MDITTYMEGRSADDYVVYDRFDRLVYVNPTLAPHPDCFPLRIQLKDLCHAACRLSVCLSAYRPMYLSIYSAVYLSIYPSVYLSVYASVHLGLFMCLHHYICTYMNACMNACMHAYIHTCFHRDLTAVSTD